LVFAHAIASRAVAVLVFLAIVFWCMARLVFRTDEGAIAKVGIWAMIVTWFLGIAASLIVWGIFPAEIISPRVQGWMVLLAIGTLALIAILVGMLRWLRWRRFQYTIAEALIGMTVFALLCGVLSMTGPLWGDPDDLASRFEIAPKGIDFFPPDVLKTGLSQSHADWAWPVAQWFYHGGPYWAVGLALTLLGCWFWIRSTRANRKTAESDRRPRLACRRVFWAALLRCLARSSWGMAVVQLIVFLAVAPDMVRLAENNYQNTMRWARDAESHCEAVQVEVDKIERDQAAMKLLEQETQDLFVP